MLLLQSTKTLENLAQHCTSLHGDDVISHDIEKCHFQTKTDFNNSFSKGNKKA